MQITEEALTSWLESEGFTIVEFSGVDDWGYTSISRREVGLSVDLLTHQRVPVLLHECLHVHYGHVGEQDQATEERIDEEVARLLVDPAEYAFWEGQYGWNTGGIASALGLPRWVIQAYRRRLARNANGC